MNFWLLFSLLCFSIGGIFSMQRQIQMFQQNSYFPSRYLKWIKSNLSIKTGYAAMFLIITAALSFVEATHYLPVIAVVELLVRVLACRSNNINSIKKLVYTARVKRLIVAALIILTILILLSVFVSSRLLSGVFAVILLALVHFSEILVL